MNEIFDYEGYKFDKGSVAKVTDPLTVEAPLQITINGESFTVVMQTPGHEKELAVGLLYAENVIRDFNNVSWDFKRSDSKLIEEILIDTPKENLADGYLSSRSLLSVSSCGICGKKEIEDLMPNEQALKQNFQTSFEAIHRMMKKMRSAQKLFDITGGCHGIAAFDKDENLLCLMEDIGRHNALDKVIGHLILIEQLKEAKVITFSGRTSYEMVSKAFRAKIPIIASVSAPSSLAVDFAKEFGLTLLSFVREDKGTCYSNIYRIADLKQ
ncbi:MAG: formate dehydrogenase accessory sulfurtransferase FdhD [Crocinitomicaceae bacterium]|nr:formate dehydrogenase accessory sulfurtransferase FdhD [Crocinitomicaceae bacterium]